MGSLFVLDKVDYVQQMFMVLIINKTLNKEIHMQHLRP